MKGHLLYFMLEGQFTPAYVCCPRKGLGCSVKTIVLSRQVKCPTKQAAFYVGTHTGSLLSHLCVSMGIVGGWGTGSRVYLR